MPFSVLHPALLVTGLACVAIPIVIHLLLRRRRKPVPWAAMRFLLEAYRRQRRRLTLEQLLLLAARCLLVALLGAALARPMLGTGALDVGPRTVVLLLDNGIAAHAAPDGTPAIEAHKELAKAALDRLDQARGDRAAIITLAAPAEVAAPPTSDLAGVRRIVEGMEALDSATDLDGGVRLAATLLDDVTPNTDWLVAADLREGSTPTERAMNPVEGLGESGVRLLLPEPAPPLDNTSVVGIDAVRSVVVADRSAPADTGATAHVRVTLRRTGPGVSTPALSTVRVRLEGDPAPIGRADLRWPAGQQTASVTVPIDSGAIDGPTAVLVGEIDRDALGADNGRRQAIEVRRSLRVGVVARARFGRVGVDQFAPADWVRLALQPTRRSAGIETVDIEPATLDSARLAGLDAVVVVEPDAVAEAAWPRVAAFVQAGGLALLVPPANATVHLWTTPALDALALPWTVSREAVEPDPPARLAPDAGPLLGLISGELTFLVEPVSVSRMLAFDQYQPGDVVLATSDGRPLALAGHDPRHARGLVVLLAAAVDPAWTDLPARPLFVAMIQELVRQGVGLAHARHAAVAGAAPGVPRGTAELAALQARDRADAIRIGADGRTRSPMRSAGAWRALDERGGQRGVVVVNPDVAGSTTGARTRAEIESWLAPIGAPGWIATGETAPQQAMADAMTVAPELPDFARPLLLIAFLLLLAESWLGRVGSHPDRFGAGIAPLSRSRGAGPSP